MSSVAYVDGSFVSRERVEKALWNLILEKAMKKTIIERFNACYPVEIGDIDYSERGFYVTPARAGFGLKLDNLGSGMRIGIRLLMLLAILSDTAVLVEEVDAYQHPESLSRLAKILFESCRESRIQLFMTTHRGESLRAFMEHFSDYPEVEGKIIGTVLSEDGRLDARPISFGEAEKLFEGGFDFRNIEDYV